MTLKGIARRYAAALFDVASRKGAETRAGQELAALAALVTGHDDLRRAIESPAVPAGRKRALMDAILTRAGGVSDEVRRTVLMLAERDRLPMLSDVAQAFEAKLLQARRIVPAEIVTAMPLADESRAAIARALGRATGGDVTLTARLDESILGGLVATVGSMVYDGSVAGQLRRLRQKLAADA